MTDDEPTPPAAMLVGISTTLRLERALWVAARLGVADHLPPSGEAGPAVPVEALAVAVDARPDPLYRVLRALAAAGIFSEVSPRAFVNTPFSDPLRRDAADSVREVVVQHGDEPEWRAWGEILHTVRTGEPAFEHVWGDSPWRYYEKTRGRMTQLSRGDSTAVAAHPIFGGAEHIVDVAGGEGSFLAAVLHANPSARGTLFDRPSIVQSAPELLRRAGVGERCQVIGGDMFDAVPSGGDLYLLKRALHDWNDERALDILRRIADAMQGRGRLVILTPLVPSGNAPSSTKLGDLALMVMLGGRQRTEVEVLALVEQAGLSVDEVVPLGGTLVAVVARGA